MLGSPLNLESRLGSPVFGKLSFVAEALGPEVSSSDQVDGRKESFILTLDILYFIVYYFIL